MDKLTKSFFRSNSDYRYYVLLKIIESSEAPLGSWILKEKVENHGIDISIATIGRLLKYLDGKGYTELIPNQGRKISSKGKMYLHSVEVDLNRYLVEKQFIEASKPRSQKDLIDLLHARMVIEVETARLASINATKEDIKKIEGSFNNHCKHVKEEQDPTEVGCHFHEVVAEASHNYFLYSTLRFLIHEEIEMEKKFPYLATRSLGGHYVQEHEDILKAIKNKNPEAAVFYMGNHMKNLIKTIEESFIGGEKRFQ
ncbi:FCD domain-containing protein [Fredinandcohnia humi]